MLTKMRKKIKPIVMHNWTEEEYKQMSKLQYLKILFYQFIYYNTAKKLLDKEFWMQFRKYYIDNMPFSFNLRYHLHLLLLIDEYRFV